VKAPPDEGLLRVGAAHYYLGGVRIDERTRTSLDGLFAAGETTGGVFGAARLGGAALSDTVVFGAMAGKEAANAAMDRPSSSLSRAHIEKERRRLASMLTSKGILATEATEKLRAAIWRYAGTMKTRQTLDRAAREFDAFEPVRSEVRAASPAQLRDALEFQNLLTNARLIVSASLLREESRGCFWRLDFPKPDNANWVKNIFQWQSGGKVQVAIRAAILTRLTPPTEPRIGAGCFPYLPPTGT
jgi:succinate dehydrogenase/fumarate reductase flavoprotein subunit